MRQMFSAATLKLTAWYLIILIAISLLFSFLLLELSTSEISSRLERLQIRAEGTSQTITLPGPLTLTDVRVNQTQEARASIFIGLVYLNIAVVSIGGIGSFLLARRTLRPIEQAHEAQAQFAADASHELRTPLAVMKSEIQVGLRDKSSTKGDYRELLESSLEEVDRLAGLSHSLLQLSRLDYSELDKTERIDITQAIHRAARSITGNADSIDVMPPERSAIIDGNRHIIDELFRILLDNAVKYGDSTAPVSVTISSNGRHCTVRVENSGPGIAKHDIHKIFDRFYRSKEARASNLPGYGLGLSLAKRIVELHEGKISVTSELGETTQFVVQLPAVHRRR